jgi:hypothetical protein
MGRPAREPLAGGRRLGSRGLCLNGGGAAPAPVHISGNGEGPLEGAAQVAAHAVTASLEGGQLPSKGRPRPDNALVQTLAGALVELRIENVLGQDAIPLGGGRRRGAHLGDVGLEVPGPGPAEICRHQQEGLVETLRHDEAVLAQQGGDGPAQHRGIRGPFHRVVRREVAGQCAALARQHAGLVVAQPDDGEFAQELHDTELASGERDLASLRLVGRRHQLAELMEMGQHALDRVANGGDVLHGVGKQRSDTV